MKTQHFTICEDCRESYIMGHELLGIAQLQRDLPLMLETKQPCCMAENTKLLATEKTDYCECCGYVEFGNWYQLTGYCPTETNQIEKETKS